MINDGTRVPFLAPAVEAPPTASPLQSLLAHLGRHP